MSKKTFIEAEEAKFYTYNFADVYVLSDRQTPLFNEREVLAAAGVQTAEIVRDQPEPPKETAIATVRKPKEIMRKTQKNLTNEKNNSQFLTFENALLLPHKILLTVDEARKLSGLPLGFLMEHRQKIAGRNYIHRSELENLVDKFCVKDALKK